MSLQDVDDFEQAIAESARVLQPGGTLLIAIVHPINLMGEFEQRDDGQPERFIMSGNWFERHATDDWCARDGLEMTFHSEHRPLVDYAEALHDAGFVIEALREPTDPDPDRPWQRMPMFLHLRAIKR